MYNLFIQKQLIKKTIFIIIIGIIAIGNLIKPVEASDNQSSVAGVTVLPAKFELYASKNQTINQSIKIVNDDSGEYLFAISLDNISVTGENGEVLIGGSSPNLSNLLSSWVKFDQSSGVLEGNSTKIINFSINIPSDTEFGGKYASIVISMDRVNRKPGEPSGVAKIVSLILVNIAGGYEDNAKIIDIDTQKINGDYDISIRVRNQGISHVKPSGTFIISDIFGRKIDEVPLNSDNVLPGSTRKMTSRWQPPSALFGYYTIALSASYGQKNSSYMTTSSSFYDFSHTGWRIAFVLILILIVSGLILMIMGLLKKKFQK